MTDTPPHTSMSFLPISDPSPLTTSQLLREIANIESKTLLRSEDFERRLSSVAELAAAKRQELGADIARLERHIEKTENGAKDLAATLQLHVSEVARLHEIAHTREHELNERSADKESHALNARLDTMNAFRAQIEAERVTYVTRELLAVELRRISEHGDQADLKGNARADGITEAFNAKFNAISDTIGVRADGNLKRIESVESQLITLTARTAEFSNLAMDVRELREFRSTAQGRGAVLTVVTSSIVGLLVSIVASLILYALTHH